MALKLQIGKWKNWISPKIAKIQTKAYTSLTDRRPWTSNKFFFIFIHDFKEILHNIREYWYIWVDRYIGCIPGGVANSNIKLLKATIFLNSYEKFKIIP